MCLLRNFFKWTCYQDLKLYNSVSGVKMNQINKFDYVKSFETEDRCLPNCWTVVRIDGKNFHKFCDLHELQKPNDKRSLELMNRSAACVMQEFHDINIAYGQSDEYSFVFRKDTTMFSRRKDKILTNVVSLFASSFAYFWSTYFGTEQLLYPPSFDGRIVLYPTDKNLRDYLNWRQADAHINNLYNTVFWSLVNKKGLTTTEAQERLKGTLSGEKNEILFKEFGMNYNNEPAMFKKGTVLVRKLMRDPSSDKTKKITIAMNCDIIGDAFWKENHEILEMKTSNLYENTEKFVTY
ncbi:probable tRNA(His) guanylyltransferase [Nilaparvata lugens]|uniref:probable tRNA(His) guanylyltransferase n=1 Tax=Nilaparvata lugens TaxID=108931 RepID=UPI00193D5E21|nr:probable tRNA(His) guanylyltransferase [Nilaparvata lugens]